MANTTSRILIELVAKADTTEFNKVIHGLTQVETKANDLQKRHDDKTRMVGQLAVKLYVLMTEIERVQGVGAK